MKVNYKQLYLLSKQQIRSLEMQINPEKAEKKKNEIPENFNQIGWDLTIDSINEMLEKLHNLREIKGKRLTPQFYRSIYNRSLIAIDEADKLIETLTLESSNIDYEKELPNLNVEIFNLQNELARKLQTK